MIILESKGLYNETGEISLNSLKTIKWTDLSDEMQPKLPTGTGIDLLITVDENTFLSGVNGIVWASYDLRQIEIIKNALFAQNIISDLLRLSGNTEEIFLLKIHNHEDVENSKDFIWKSSSGLRLKPDWSYPKGESNKSFDQWLSGQ